jgi:hypothetical protein
VAQPLTVSVLLTDTVATARSQPQPPLPSGWRVVDGWADVDTDLVVFMRHGDAVAESSPDGIASIFSSSDVAIAWSACVEEPRSLPQGIYAAEDCLTAVVEAHALGPVVLRVSGVRPEHRSHGLLFEPLLAGIGAGRAVVVAAPLLDPGTGPSTPPPPTAGSWRDPARLRPFGHRRRWHDPSETDQWLQALDRLAGAGTLTLQAELAVTAALLRRIVLLPDLAESGAMATHGVLIIDALGARAEQLVQGRQPRRSRPAIAVIDVGCDLGTLPTASWWEPVGPHSEPAQLISQSAILAGPETDQDELRRFEIDMGGAG